MNWNNLLRKKSIPDIVAEHAANQNKSGLKRVLGTFDLTMFGIAAVVGAGIFSTIGNAAFYGGPAVVLLFIFTAIACGFCALCYAEFASKIPIAGSAYTYSYVAFGELIAWIIGWDLLMEYAIGDIAITISWSQYLVGLVKYWGFDIPVHFTMDFLSAQRGFEQVSALLSQGFSLEQITQKISDPLVLKGYAAWMSAPTLGSLHIVCDLPAFVVTLIITWIIFIGIEDSKRITSFMVVLKMAVIFFVIAVGLFYINPDNWVPFAPNGSAGVLKGVSAVFFAYIGFDVISTMAEECREPQRDLPRAMLYSLIICTLIYAVLALIITGVAHYTKLQVGDPLAYIFGPEGANIPWFSGVIAMTAVIALAGVLLVYQLGQTRIWMVMGRDGLLPSFFSTIHPKYKTPWISTLISGLFVAIPSLFLNLTEVTDLNSIGTLFAFVLVSAGVLVMKPEAQVNQRFKIPYINAKYLYPVLVILMVATLIVLQVNGFATFWGDLSDTEKLYHHIPFFVFVIEVLVLCYLSFRKNLSFIPVMGLTLSSYLISELGMKTWIRFGIWLAIGACLYFAYGYRKSKLANRNLIQAKWMRG